MSVIAKLASSLGRGYETPNQALAWQIVKKSDSKAVNELVANLANNDKNIQSDCIKVLYEIGYRNPAMIAPFHKDFLALLANKSNSLVWGAMTALDTITLEEPKSIYAALPKIMKVADEGTVITRDHAVAVLTKCPAHQLPTYAENGLPIVCEKYRSNFVAVLKTRLRDVETESRRRRMEKVLKKRETMNHV